MHCTYIPTENRNNPSAYLHTLLLLVFPWVVCLVERFSRETSIDLFLLLLRLEYSTPWRIKSVRSFVRGRHKKKKNVINEDEKKKKKMVANMSLAFGLKKPFGPCAGEK
jgi:hypothetical protein